MFDIESNKIPLLADGKAKYFLFDVSTFLFEIEMLLPPKPLIKP